MPESIIIDYKTRACDKLQRLKQKTSVSTYLPKFRNGTHTVSDMADGENYGRFVEFIDHEVKI